MWPNSANSSRLQVAANELLRGHKVFWIGARCHDFLLAISADSTLDADGGRCAERVRSVLAHRSQSTISTPAADATTSKYLSNFTSLTMPTLSQLLALLLHPKPDFPPEKTSLLIVEDFNMLVDVDYPRILFNSAGKTEQQKWQAGRRYAVLGTFITALNKLATLKDFAALVTTGCASRTRSGTGGGSALVPGIGGQEWDSGIWNRIAVFRDFSTRFVGVQKLRGRSLISREEIGEAGKLFAFDIDPTGHILQRTADERLMPSDIAKKVLRSPVKARKRRFDEIADSEDEEADEYGWANTDEDAFADSTHGDPGPGPVG